MSQSVISKFLNTFCVANKNTLYHKLSGNTVAQQIIQGQLRIVNCTLISAETVMASVATLLILRGKSANTNFHLQNVRASLSISVVVRMSILDKKG